MKNSKDKNKQTAMITNKRDKQYPGKMVKTKAKKQKQKSPKETDAQSK